MTAGPRIKLRIDRIVTDRPGLDGAALSRALQAEVERILAEHGPDGFGTGRNLAFGRQSVAPGQQPRAARVAQATLAAVRS